MAELHVKLRGGHSSSSLCVDAKTDGSLIISGGEDGEVCVWSRDGTLIHKQQNEQDDCTSVIISKTREHTFYTSFGNSIKVLDTRNLQNVVESYQFNEEEINQLVLDEKEGYLAASDDAGETRIISLDDKKLYKTLRRKHTNICSTVCFRTRRPWEIFSGGMDCNLIHWDFSRPKCLNQFNMQELQDAPSELGAYMVNPPFVHHLSMSPDGKYLAAALENGVVTVFDSSKKHIAEIFSLHAHTRGVSQVNFVSDTKLLSGGNDCRVALWDLAKMNDLPEGNQASATNGHTSPIHHRNTEVTENCRVDEIQHSSKINWMKYFNDNGTGFVVLSDQTPELTMIPIQL